MSRAWTGVLALLFLVNVARADVVTLKNGDRLPGPWSPSKVAHCN